MTFENWMKKNHPNTSFTSSIPSFTPQTTAKEFNEAYKTHKLKEEWQNQEFVEDMIMFDHLGNIWEDKKS